jgi:phospholipase/lecithinase/hemolysin
MNSIKDLLDAGAKNLLVFNQAPIQALPNFDVYHQNAYFTSLTQIGNNALNTTLISLQQNYKHASIYMFDLHALITDILSTNSSTFIDTVDACWTTFNVTTIIQNCTDPREYVFLDSIHFSSTVQKKIADAIQPFLFWNFNKHAPSPYIIPY